jgi:hypothetical protein
LEYLPEREEKKEAQKAKKKELPITAKGGMLMRKGLLGECLISLSIESFPLSCSTWPDVSVRQVIRSDHQMKNNSITCGKTIAAAASPPHATHQP